MKYFGNEYTLEDGLKREWLITNGIGGYASSTIVGANTRKYHGLLIAPLMPPARRCMIVSKIDESIEIDGKEHNLYTNVCQNFISDGYKNLVEFKDSHLPAFYYDVNGIKVTKVISMIHGRNITCILYKIKNINKNVKLKLTPIINFRDFHSVTTKTNFNLSQEIKPNKVEITVNKYLGARPIYIGCSEGNYIQYENKIFENMYYIEEEKRGFPAIENHAIPGTFEVNIRTK